MPPLPAQAQSNIADPGPFFAMLNQSASGFAFAPEIFQGSDQGSGDGGLDLDFFDSINAALDRASMASQPNPSVVTVLQAAHVPFTITPNGQVYVPSMGGFAVPASSGIGIPASSYANGTANPDPNLIVVTAWQTQTQSQTYGNLLVNPFATGSSLPNASTSVSGAGAIFSPVTATVSIHPVGFDVARDAAADRLADEIGREILAKTDFATREYGAIIWVDTTGVLHRTTVVGGTAINAPLDSVMGQIGRGGLIVAMVHSHPHTFNGGSIANPIWTTNTLAGTLSSLDFDILMAVGRGSVTMNGIAYDMTRGYDSVNYRSYLVSSAGVSEFYASDQNRSYVGAGGQAIWAVRSSDYSTNVPRPSP